MNAVFIRIMLRQLRALSYTRRMKFIAMLSFLITFSPAIRID